MSLSLSINSPCSENWNSFEKNGNTGFCSSCQKNVIDFTKYSDRQIVDFFEKNKGNTCGRLRADQLKFYQEESKSSFYKIAAVLTAGVLTLSQAPEATAQTKKWITGRVLEEQDSLPMPGTNVLLKGDPNGTVSDANGYFRLPYSGSQKQVTVTFSFIGYLNYEKVVDLTQTTTTGDVVLNIDEVALSEVVYMGGMCTRRGLWARMTSIFRK